MHHSNSRQPIQNVGACGGYLNLQKANILPEELEAAFNIISNYPQIRRLGLSHNPSLGPAGAEQLANMLRKVILEETKFGEGHENTVEEEKVHQLRELFLSECGFRAEGLSQLAEALIVSQAEKIGLNQNELGDAGCFHMRNILDTSQLRNLQVLGLIQNGIGDEGALAIAEALSNNIGLKRLYLNDNVIGDDGAVALSVALSTHRCLERLGVTFNCIRDGGSLALFAVVSRLATVSSRKFEKLCIFGNPFSEEARLQLMECSVVFATKKTRTRIAQHQKVPL